MTEYGRYIELKDLGKFAEETALAIRPSGTVRGRRIARRITAELRSVSEAAEKISRLVADGPERLRGAAEWILDNWYLCEREGIETVPAFAEAGLIPALWGDSGGTVIGAAAAKLVRSGSGELSPERIGVFFDSFQNIQILGEKELSLLIPSLKMELIVFLREICSDVVSGADNADTESAARGIFTSLRFLASFDVAEMLEDINRTEQVLRTDPGGIYPRMDEHTRIYYRNALSRLAARSKQSEYDTAVNVVETAKSGGGHVGDILLGHEKKGKKGRERSYIGTIVLITLFLTVLAGFLLKNPLVSLLLLLPISDIVKNLVDFTAVKSVKPCRVPRLELKNGIPYDGRTLCAVSVLLTSEKGILSAIKRMEEYRLANRDAGENLLFGILADLPEAQEETVPSDAALIEAASKGIAALNGKYGGGFYFFLRGRVYSHVDGRYMGHERKRGAILELVRLLRGRPSPVLSLPEGSGVPADVKYIIALDADTRLCAGAARELTGAAMHPLNRPVIDREKGIVVSGAGIIQPCISVELRAAGRSDFSAIFAGQGGVDPYGSASSDVYQDMFGAGSFTGKGIIDTEAYEACLDGAFPENRILSHDLLEGAYMHCIYMGDVELTDGFPYRATAYYARMHRWVRGDWQTMPWLGKTVRNAAGKRVKNPLSEIDKWKIFDNLRRSLVPVFTFLSLAAGMLLSSTDFAWAAAVAILSAVSALLIASAESMFRRGAGVRTRYHSAVISGFGGWLLQTLVRLILLPLEAWIDFHAAVTAIFRMMVTKRKLLEWVTASDTERKMRNTVAENYRKMWFCVLAGVLIAIVTPFAPAMAVGIIWITAPLYAVALSRDNEMKKRFSESEKMFLLGACGDIWRYFTDFLTAQDHYLPPDNWQEQPATGLAHRTSPTNIGLALLSAIAALDMGIASKHSAMGIVENVLATVERMPKLNGHLYNWYDTRTLQPLKPACISSVDSGNLAACLITLREALLELGEEKLAQKACTLYESMRFNFLYDERRRLFYIGWDAERNTPVDGWYDLMASEARETSFVAVARGDVPRRHWRRLGRSLVSQDRYCGMASWTGTMFEYLMPNLILPCYKNSLIYESVKFCLYAQKKRVPGGVPWGISESAYWALDPLLNYRYKAHGVQRLALNRGMDDETVISPYSTFIALSTDPAGALKNLMKMREMGMEGRYGFYDAADFTPSRCGNAHFRSVKTFMVHHMGMSIIAADNALNEDIMPTRFMRNVEMAAFAELLQEKVPVGAPILRQAPRDVPEKPGRGDSGSWSTRYDGVDIRSPRCCLVSNGAYSVLLTETGQSRSTCGGLMVMGDDGLYPMREGGVIFRLKTSAGIMNLTPSPGFDPGVEYSALFSDTEGKLTARRGEIGTSVSLTVPHDEAGEIRDVEISYSGSTVVDAELLCDFEPVLARKEDYAAHPAFMRLLLEAMNSGNSLIVKRRPRGKEKDGCLCIACSEPVVFESVGRNKSAISALDASGRGGYEALPGGHLRARIPIKLTQDSPCRVRLAIACAQTESDVRPAVDRLLRGDTAPTIKSGKYGVPAQIVGQAMDRISRLLFGGDTRPAAAEADTEGVCGLWRLGISGDMPVFAVRTNEKQTKRASELICEHAFLSENNFEYDLVFLMSDGGDYRQPVRSILTETLRELGREWSVGARGGVHFVDETAGGVQSVMALAGSYCDLSSQEAPYVRRTGVYPPAKPERTENGERPSFGYLENGDFWFTVRYTLPEKAWSHVLASERFGFIATDAGTGHMWYLNSRENKINRWLSGGLAAEGTERLEVWQNGRHCSLFAAQDGTVCRVTYGFGFARWEKEIGGSKFVTTMFVPRDIPARIIVIEAANQESGAEIAYFTELVLGADEKSGLRIKTEFRDGAFFARDASSPEFPDTRFCITSSEIPTRYTSDTISWLIGEPDFKTDGSSRPCAGLVFPQRDRLVIVTGCGDEAALRSAADWGAANELLRSTVEKWRTDMGTVEVDTPDEAMNRYLSGWAMYQTVACRIMARSSVYQCGGAYGFRDQLQDACAVMTWQPDMAKRLLLTAAAHQYVEGDVQHWWHPGAKNEKSSDKGMRTKCSDDLLWLPYTLCRYVEITGDESVLELQSEYLCSCPLNSNEHERYEIPERSGISEPLLEHALRAIRLVLERGAGSHGLCHMGTGDWNDGMNLVGASGMGESVWLTWFASVTLGLMAKLLEKAGRSELVGGCENASAKLRTAGEGAWDGKWFLRGFYDDGMPLGSAECDECRIDSIAQSFAQFAGADPEKTHSGLEQAVMRLYDRENRLIKLFEPPFYTGKQEPGYIKSYCAGFRENGGQYTHGAVWLARALLQSGDIQTGYGILSDLLPQNHDVTIYKAEPYVLAADVYAGKGYEGEGGWSWYTGAAGWYYRTALEDLLGLRVRDGRLFIEPNLPKTWSGYSAVWKGGENELHISVRGSGPYEVTVNGQPYCEEGYSLNF